jgi:hypothetical protein
MSFEDMIPLEDGASSKVDRIQLDQFTISRYLEEPEFNTHQQTTALVENNDHDSELGPNA